MRMNRLPHHLIRAVMTAALMHAAAAADLKHGEQLFEDCTVCHSPFGEGLGPALTGVYGQKAGQRTDFSLYSPAMKASGLVWDEKTLRAYLKSPQSVVKGTSMDFKGYDSDKDLDDVIAYLKTLK
jgi:cytochrome c